MEVQRFLFARGVVDRLFRSGKKAIHEIHETTRKRLRTMFHEIGRVICSCFFV
jgi:hypothetical protein